MPTAGIQDPWIDEFKFTSDLHIASSVRNYETSQSVPVCDYTHTHMHTNAHTRTHTHTQTHRHTDTQTHRHTDTQTAAPCLGAWLLVQIDPGIASTPKAKAVLKQKVLEGRQMLASDDICYTCCILKVSRSTVYPPLCCLVVCMRVCMRVCVCVCVA